MRRNTRARAEVRRWLAWALVAPLTLPTAGCAAARPTSTPAGSPTSAATATPSGSSWGHRPAGAPAARAGSVWLHSLQMISPTAGWALLWTGDPNSTTPVSLALGRTTDGARTWTDVTPSAARALLTANDSYPVLLGRTASLAWLAVTKERSDASYGVTPHLTEVFRSTDGGRSWTASAPIRAPGGAGWLAFSDPAHGWLMQDLGSAMQQDHVQVYRTSDGGMSWALVAQTRPWPRTGTSASGLPVSCDKTGIAFATTKAGWITGGCFSLDLALLVTHDGGRTWASQPLPLPASTCQRSECDIGPPAFFGQTGFLAVGSYPGPGYLLTSDDTGATWKAERLAPGLGPYPLIHFFDARHGLLVPTGPQGTAARVLYATSDGGRTWLPIPQGGPGWPPGTTIEFVSGSAGFAWSLNAQAPVIYATVNAGRTWTRFSPLG